MWFSRRKRGANIKEIQIITKEFSRLERYEGMADEISKKNYGSKNEILGGRGQRKVFSGEACRYVSCIMVRILENKKLIIIIKRGYNGEIEQRVVISRVDYADFCTSGKYCEKKT